MALHPRMDGIDQVRWHMTLKHSLPALPADVPGGIAAQDATGRSNGNQQPWTPVACHKPQKQQICTARQRQRNNGKINYGNRKKPKRSEAHDPVQRARVMSMRFD
ncbi:MAG: hypothetical protein WA673_24545, partial [Candidatus Acidiferrales bacterium]